MSLEIGQIVSQLTVIGAMNELLARPSQELDEEYHQPNSIGYKYGNTYVACDTSLQKPPSSPSPSQSIPSAISPVTNTSNSDISHLRLREPARHDAEPTQAIAISLEKYPAIQSHERKVKRNKCKLAPSAIADMELTCPSQMSESEENLYLDPEMKDSKML
ncbi:hypothetical protein B9Z19DRAFT_1064271 [Tuber borchii]|uniref:Uncharacterized protein n=1 Tax=Tuber borchii TaxID=42251 RepID=A0A2T6ZV91_TUBBO|nr:hypothetical protein B9Z19DRAFT_1064271 [Tuber borchii]